MAAERTLVLVKPDGLKRRLVGEIISRFERKGLRLIALKELQLTQAKAEKHYSVHKDKPFFKDLVQYIISGPIVAMILEGNNAISVVRGMCGATDGSKANPGTIRGDFALSIQNNIVHASDSTDAYQHEGSIFFAENELHEFSYGDEQLI